MEQSGVLNQDHVPDLGTAERRIAEYSTVAEYQREKFPNASNF